MKNSNYKWLLTTEFDLNKIEEYVENLYKIYKIDIRLNQELLAEESANIKDFIIKDFLKIVHKYNFKQKDYCYDTLKNSIKISILSSNEDATQLYKMLQLDLSKTYIKQFITNMEIAKIDLNHSSPLELLNQKEEDYEQTFDYKLTTPEEIKNKAESIFIKIKKDILEKFDLELKNFWIPIFRKKANSVLLITNKDLSTLTDESYKRIEEIDNYISKTYNNDMFYFSLS